MAVAADATAARVQKAAIVLGHAGYVADGALRILGQPLAGGAQPTRSVGNGEGRVKIAGRERGAQAAYGFEPRWIEDERIQLDQAGCGRTA